MNKVVMMGRLTADPEIRYGQSGTCVANFSIAVDRKFTREGEPTADFFNCVAFGKTAEFAEKYLKKGVKIVTDGHLQNDSFTDREGNKRTVTKIMIEAVEFAESKAASEQSRGGQQGYQKPQQQPTYGTTPEGFMEIPAGIEEELPFT